MRLKSNVRWTDLPGVECAYQSIGAPSAVDALLNVAHDHRSVGKFTAMPGVLPAWSAMTGWGFDGTQYLKTGITTVTTQWSGLARFSWNGVGVCFVWGEYQTGKLFGNYVHGSGWWYLNGDEKNKFPAYLPGVIGQAGITGYRNGVADLATNSGFAGTSTAEVGIGATGLGQYKLTGSIQSFVLASRTFTPAEMWLASQQMKYCEQNPDWNAWGRRRNYYFAPSAAAGVRWPGVGRGGPVGGSPGIRGSQ